MWDEISVPSQTSERLILRPLRHTPFGTPWAEGLRTENPTARGFHEPTGDELAFVRGHARTDRGRLALLVLLKGHQRLGRLPSARSVPPHVRAYLAAVLGRPTDTPLGARTRQTRHRYRQAIDGFLSIRSYSEGGRTIAAKAMRKAASVMSGPADLVNVAVEVLVRDGSRSPLSARSTASQVGGARRSTARSTRSSPGGTDALKEALHERMPERHLLDVLKNTAAWARHFGPPSRSDPKLAAPQRRYLLAVFGYGTGLGPAQFSRHARASGADRAVRIPPRATLAPGPPPGRARPRSVRSSSRTASTSRPLRWKPPAATSSPSTPGSSSPSTGERV